MRLLYLSLLGAALASAQQYRAFWVDAYHSGLKTPVEVDQLIADVEQARANTIMAEVRREGGSYYLQSEEPPAQDTAYPPGFDALQYLIERAHARGLEVHAWFPVMPLWRDAQPPTDPRHLWYRHGPRTAGPDFWMTTTSDGKFGTSLDPGHPAVLRYLADLLVNVAGAYDIDGLHLDYIRYPEDADYGWNPTAVARFQRLTGRLDLPTTRDLEWDSFRRAQVTALVRQVYLRSLAAKPWLKISAAVITWGDGPASEAEYRRKDAYSRVFQDWRGWLEEGIVDLAMPMNYFREDRNASFLDHWLAFERGHTYARGLIVGLAPYLNTIPESLRQLQRTLAPASEPPPLGVAWYSYASTNTLNVQGLPTLPNGQFYDAMAQYFWEDARTPALPWKTNAQTGHLAGRLSGADDSVDGVDIVVESDTGQPLARTLQTDATGFFGTVDLPPDRYRVRLRREGREEVVSPAQDVVAGHVTVIDFLFQ